MWRWIAFAIVCAVWPITRLAANEFPYVGVVTDEDTALHSGPGRVHYPTAQLSAGAQIEVYRHDPGGWLAVRPPEGSFSWIDAKYVSQPGADNVAEVSVDGATAWVGSSASDVEEYLWQVRFKRGEFVQLLGQSQMADPEDGRLVTWYKIAPPAGEFRWIHESHVARVPSNISAVADNGVQAANFADGSSKSSGTLADSVDGAIRLADHSEAAEGEESSAVTSSDGFTARRKDPSGVKTAEPNATESAGSTASQTKQPLDFVTQLHDIDIEFTLMATRDPSEWDVEALRRRITALMGVSSNAAERSRAQRLLSHIDSFDRFQQRYLAHNDEDSSGEIAEGRLGGLGRSNDLDSTDLSRGADVLDATDSRTYDAVGWLMPVHSSRRDLPAYALLDDQGMLIRYVTPAPGFNLNRYLHMKLGIIGDRGFAPSLNAQHMTAERVKVLGTQRR